MKRIKKNTRMSIVLLSIGAFLVPLFFITGSLIVGIGTVGFIVLGFLARKPESYDAYSNRYERKYGTGDSAEEEEP